MDVVRAMLPEVEKQTGTRARITVNICRLHLFH
jgi:hypothetical protein